VFLSLYWMPGYKKTIARSDRMAKRIQGEPLAQLGRAGTLPTASTSVGPGDGS
jgi:hypothetical protein